MLKLSPIRRSSMRRLVAFALVAFLLGDAAFAGPYEDGIAAARRGDYVVAAQLWKQLADNGMGEAQSNLGYLYEIGAGVPKDYSAALMWYRRGADQDNTNAQFNLAGMYYN